MQMPANHFRAVTIDGVEYRIKLLDGLTGFRTAKDITKIVLPLLGESFDASRHDDVFHGAPKTFKDMSLLLLTQVDQVDIEDIIFNRLFRYFVVDGADAKLQDLIIGKYEILIDLVSFALKENFGSMFEGKGLLTRFQGIFSQATSLI